MSDTKTPRAALLHNKVARAWLYVQSVSQRVESTVRETEQQPTLTEKLPFLTNPPSPQALLYSLAPLPHHFLCFLFHLFFPLPLPRLVFLSGLKGMLSGPITQEDGITKTRASEEERERGR